MNLTVQRVLAGVIAAAGMLFAIGYGVVLALVEDRQAAAEEWGSLTGFGLFAAFVALLWLLATLRLGRDSQATTRTPPAWLSFILLIVIVGAGFGLAQLDVALYVAPLLVPLGFLLVGAFFLRLATRWMPRRRTPLEGFVMPGAFGVYLSPVLLLPLQAAAVVAILVAVFAGIYADNPDFELDPNLNERVSEYIEEQAGEATTTEVPEIVEAPTVALSLLAVLAFVAPVTEELIKAGGAILILSRRPVITSSDVLLAAVGSSLGFALFEGVGYTLQAGESWPQLMLLRAPVIVMHIAATTIVVVGWQRMRETGRGLLPYFLAGTALHAGWNGLQAGFLYSLTGVEAGADPGAAQALSVLAVVGLIGALFVAAFAWFLYVSRKAGLTERRATLAEESVKQSQALHGALLRNA